MDSPRGLFATVREALRGGTHDFTVGSLDRALVLLAIPMVAEMLMESLFAVVDVFFVGKLGPEAVAAVGLTESLLAIVYAMAMGVAMAATAVVARRVGERKPEEAAAAAGQSILLGAVVSSIIAVVGVLFAPAMLRAMGAEESVVRVGGPYAAVMLGGNATIVALFVMNAIFRGAGDAAISMRVLWIANGLNIVLGPLFIFGIGPFPRLGVLGAAVATTLGRAIGVALQIFALAFGHARVAVRLRHLRPDLGTLRAMFGIASSGTLQSVVGTASWIVLSRILAAFGSAALAGYTIGMRIVMFAILPSWGLSNAAATMVGQNLGAGRADRAEQAVWRAGWWNTAVLTAIGVLFVVFARPICAPFTSDPAVLSHAADSLRIVSFGFLFYGFGMVFGQAFNGAGDTWTPTWLNLAAFWAFELPLAWILAHHGFGAHGVYGSIALAFSAMAVASGLVFRRGAWKTRKV